MKNETILRRSVRQRAALIPLLIGCVLTSFVGCGARDPLEEMIVARRSYDVVPLGWTTRPAEDGEGMIGYMSVRVTERGAPLALDCLTVRLVFFDESGETRVAEIPKEIDVAGLGRGSGSKEVTIRTDVPEGAGHDVTIEVPEVTSEVELKRLCEGKVLAPKRNE